MSLLISSAVRDLQPLMERLSRSCSESNINDLTRAISSLPPAVLQSIHSYILVPLFGELIDFKHGVKIKTGLLECAYLILKVVHLSDVSTTLNLLNVLMMQLFDKDSPTMIRAVPEEMKLITLRCALSIIDNMTLDVRNEFYDKNNIPVICQISYTSMQVAESEKFRTLRVCAMELVLALLQVPRNGGREPSIEERKKIGDVFQFVLPGASAKLATIVAGDVTQGSHVISTAVCALSTMIAHVMEDYHEGNLSNNLTEMILETVKKSNNAISEDKQQEIQFSKDKAGMQKLINTSEGRTPSWKKNVGRNLTPALKKIAALQFHSNPKVCKEVARSCGLLLLRCPTSLMEGLPPLLDALIILSVHDDTSVREESKQAITQLRESFSGPNGHTFMELVEENFFMLLTRLPRIVQEDGSSRGLSALGLLNGYVRLMHSSMKRVLSSSAHLQRLTLSLLHSLSLDCSGINVGQEHAIRTLTPVCLEDVKCPWTQLCFSNNSAALSSVRSLCSLMAEPSCGAIEMLGNQLMDTMRFVPQFYKESIIALNLVLSSSNTHSNDYLLQLAMSILELYLSPEYWLSHEQLMEVSSVNQLQNDILVACLLADGVGCCAQALGADRARPLLLRLLYPLLERAGSANAAISLAGRCGLTRVSAACGYDTDLMAMLADNMDYVSHSMAMCLRHYDGQRGVFDALSMILQHTSPTIAIGLQNIVHNVLHQSGSIRQSKSNDAHLRVFLTFARGVHLWLGPKADTKIQKNSNLKKVIQKLQDDSDESEVICLSSASPVSKVWCAVEKFKQYQNAKQSEMMEESEMEIDSTASDEQESNHVSANAVEKDFDDDSRKKDIPELAKLLILVLQRCIHFLPVNVIDHQFLALETLQAGLLALQPYTDTLLPIAHQIWSPLIVRLHANQPPLIIRAAFRLLLTMADTARDFLLSRTIREVLPQLNAFLKNSVHHSKLQDHGATYRYSQMYKTQKALLEGLGPLVTHMQFRGQDFYNILITVLPYLSCYQPKPLQVACKALVQSLLDLDADATWWALVAWWTPPKLAICLQLPEVSHHDDCRDNICDLLKLAGGHEKDLEN